MEHYYILKIDSNCVVDCKRTVGLNVLHFFFFCLKIEILKNKNRAKKKINNINMVASCRGVKYTFFLHAIIFQNYYL